MHSEVVQKERDASRVLKLLMMSEKKKISYKLVLNERYLQETALCRELC